MTGFLGDWRRTLPRRGHYLVRPLAQALGGYLAAYAGLTALLRPWQLAGWWSFGVPLVAGFGVCWWLWRPWGLLARNYKGESRRLPLYLVWLLCLALGWTGRQYMHARLSPVRDLRSVRELAQPGEATYFRLHGPFYIAQSDCGKFANTDFFQGKNSTKTYYANRYYACPLLPTAADTATGAGPIAAWLGYRYHEALGQDLVGGELQWRFINAVARCDARFDTLNLTRFAYLEREAEPVSYLYQAVRASRLATGRIQGEPLLLKPVQTPFAARGNYLLRAAFFILLAGSVVIVFLLLVMPIRPPTDWPAPLG